jgi:hypothetical protein
MNVQSSDPKGVVKTACRQRQKSKVPSSFFRVARPKRSVGVGRSASDSHALRTSGRATPVGEGGRNFRFFCILATDLALTFQSLDTPHKNRSRMQKDLWTCYSKKGI